MDINTIKEKVVVFVGSWGWREWLIFALLIAIAVFVLLKPSATVPPNATAAINAAVEMAKKPLFEQIAYDEEQITGWHDKFVVADGKYKAWKKKYDDLQGRKENVKPPTSYQELVTRYNTLGFTPLPIDKYGPGVLCFSTGYSK